ncbi:hypothetical protein [Nostoc sp. FACHB-110]|uniref:hypothetical protein n=1 Tax=Nostoc sp. FACHB-110 TaxID=2692834 RepID=UPI001683F6B0|nr:hypothetical protein [Nostoc sp. FACHB-110]MBD2441348.1 hypothetical protein [Nostoc sp. FACHB-110]
MNFYQLRTGEYFRIPGMSCGYVYKKVSNSCCRLNGFLQPIHSQSLVKRLNVAEIKQYLAQQQAELVSFETDYY